MGSFGASGFDRTREGTEKKITELKRQDYTHVIVSDCAAALPFLLCCKLTKSAGTLSYKNLV
jgi:hypothetical protein